jgi:hypothetical protein
LAETKGNEGTITFKGVKEGVCGKRIHTNETFKAP